MGSSRMSEVMDPDVRQSSPSEGLMELSAHAASVQRPSGGTCENETLTCGQRFVGLPAPVRGEGSHCARCKVDGSSTAVRFGFDEHNSPEPLGQPLERASDRQTTPFEVDVGPGQTEGLSESQSSC